MLEQRGYDARNVVGGMLAWEAAGLPVVRDGGQPGQQGDPRDDAVEVEPLREGVVVAAHRSEAVAASPGPVVPSPA